MDDIEAEKKTNIWCNRRLSKGGRLVLVKVVLEAIPIYWILLDWVPKGVLETIGKLFYKLIWSRDPKNQFLVPISWKKLALPKAFGGLGIQNPFLFSKSLLAKNVWRLIEGTCLWVWVVKAEYIHPNIVEDWIRSPIKQ